MYEKLEFYFDKLGNPKKLPKDVVGQQAFLCSILVKNNFGKYIQAVFSNKYMLDLKLINSLDASSSYTAESPEKIAKLLRNLDLDILMPFPNLLNIPFIADISSMDTEYIFIQSEQEYFVYKVKTDKLKEIYKDYNRKIAKKVQISQNNFTSFDDEASLKKAIENLTQRRIEERLEDELNIPPLPVSFRKLINLKNSDKKIVVKDLLEIIELDPVLASQVLRWANSPFYTRGEKVSSITDALVKILSLDVALDLLLGVSLTSHLKLPKHGVHGYNKFWYDSMRRAMLAKFIGETLDSEDLKPTLAYTAGLLSNYGYLILAEVFPPYFNMYCRYQEANPFLEHNYIEQHLFGMVREQMASFLFNVWELPVELRVAIRQQHNPNYFGKNYKYPNLLYLVNTVLTEENNFFNSKSVPNNIYKNLNLTNEEVILAKTKLLDYDDEFFSSIFSA